MSLPLPSPVDESRRFSNMGGNSSGLGLDTASPVWLDSHLRRRDRSMMAWMTRTASANDSESKAASGSVSSATDHAPGWRSFGWLAIVVFVAISAADATWRVNPVFHDHWIYYGFQRNLTAHLRDFAWTYWATRLAILIPGAAAQRVFGLATGEIILHAGLLAVSLWAMRACGRRMFGERAGALAVVLAGTHFFFLQGMASDYTDGYGQCYLLLTAAALLRALDPGRGRNLAAACAGFFAACVVLTNIAFVAFLPVLTGAVLAGRPWGGGRTWAISKRLAIVTAIGAVSFGATLTLAEFWFHAHTDVHIWQPNLHFIREFRNDETFAIQDQRNSLAEWLPGASWLIWPAIVTAAGAISLVDLLRNPAGTSAARARTLAWLTLVPAALLIGTLADVSLKLDMFGRLWFYGVVLYQPLAILLAAGLLDRYLPDAGKAAARFLPAGVLLAVGLAAVHGAGVVKGIAPGEVNETAVFALTFLAGVGGFAATMAGSVRNVPVLFFTGLAVIGAVQGPQRAMFRVDAGRTPALVEFAMLDRCRELDARARTDTAAAVQEAVERCLELAPANDLGFWYDKNAAMAPAFEMVNATFAYGRILSKDMSDIRAKPLGGMQVGLEPGRVVVVLTDDVETARAAADREFARLAVRAYDLGVRQIGHGPVRFCLMAWEIEQAPEELAGELGRVRIGHRSGAGETNGVRR
ncbi:hypothetical protein GC170_00270 [bacterium]|nr:hypothetical protein [bacterium]